MQGYGSEVVGDGMDERELQKCGETHFRNVVRRQVVTKRSLGGSPHDAWQLADPWQSQFHKLAILLVGRGQQAVTW